MADQQKIDEKQRRLNRSNRTVAVACLSFFVCMIGAAYASVPLYRIFCQVTGYGGTTQRVEQYSDTILDKTMKVRFDANTANGLPWDFKPVEREVTVRIGETTMIKYEARNLFDEPTYGRASFNVAPGRAGPISTRSNVSVSLIRLCSRAKTWKCRLFSSLTLRSSTTRI